MIPVLLLLFLGCGREPPGECVDNGDCAGVAICGEDKACVEVECLSSLHCPLGTHCDSHVCFTGCAENTDCVPGQVCDTGASTCVPGECDDAEIDCSWGQSCQDGACGVPEGQCMPCSGTSTTLCTGELGGQCRFAGGVYSCLLPCDPSGNAAQRPRGFDCIDVGFSTTEQWVWGGDCSKIEETQE